jgi:hypothetical protein
MIATIYLKSFDLIDKFCTKIGTRAYLWGGWIPDIYSGKLLREHDDAEFLILNLYDFKQNIQNVFNDLNWETKIISNDDLVVKKDGMKIQFGHLEINSDKAIWLHNGLKGQIVFPKQWLNKKRLNFLGNSFHAVTPEFQYVLKLHPEFMNSKWIPREKDKEDIKVLRSLLLEKQSNLKMINNLLIVNKITG